MPSLRGLVRNCRRLSATGARECITGVCGCCLSSGAAAGPPLPGRSGYPLTVKFACEKPPIPSWIENNQGRARAWATVIGNTPFVAFPIWSDQGSRGDSRRPQVECGIMRCAGNQGRCVQHARSFARFLVLLEKCARLNPGSSQRRANSNRRLVLDWSGQPRCDIDLPYSSPSCGLGVRTGKTTAVVHVLPGMRGVEIHRAGPREHPRSGAVTLRGVRRLSGQSPSACSPLSFSNCAGHTFLIRTGHQHPGSPGQCVQ
jgi:hypothetical protein